MKLSVNLVIWNGAKYIPYLFESLRNQTLSVKGRSVSRGDWQLVILDNASTDESLDIIENELKDFPVETEVIKGEENLGFAGGHNFLSLEPNVQNSEYILLLNQDMYLEKDCIERLVEFMDKNRNAAVVSPRLMKWDFDLLQKSSDSNVQASLTNKIDSLGLRVLKNRRVLEKYTGKEWSTIRPKIEMSFRTEDNAKEVFGVSGALPMFRKEIIDEVGWFDKSFRSYKEDVDLAYRLRSEGYQAYVLLDAVAYHDRSAQGLEKVSDKVIVENKRKQSDQVKYNSYKNHLITLYKNEYLQNFVLDSLWIKWYECKKFWYYLLFDRKVLGGLREIWSMRRDLKAKRREIKRRRRVGYKEIRKWIR